MPYAAPDALAQHVRAFFPECVTTLNRVTGQVYQQIKHLSDPEDLGAHLHFLEARVRSFLWQSGDRRDVELQLLPGGQQVHLILVDATKPAPAEFTTQRLLDAQAEVRSPEGLGE